MSAALLRVPLLQRPLLLPLLLSPPQLLLGRRLLQPLARRCRRTAMSPLSLAVNSGRQRLCAAGLIWMPQALKVKRQAPPRHVTQRTMTMAGWLAAAQAALSGAVEAAAVVVVLVVVLLLLQVMMMMKPLQPEVQQQELRQP